MILAQGIGAKATGIVRSGVGTVPLDEDVKYIGAGECERGGDSDVADAPVTRTLGYIQVTMQVMLVREPV